MRVRDMVETWNMTVVSGANNLDREIHRGYVSDLMSDVIANADEGDVWVTFQVHLNVVAIALMKKLSAVVLVHGRQLLPEALEKATEEGLPVLSTQDTAFETVGKLHGAGIPG